MATSQTVKPQLSQQSTKEHNLVVLRRSDPCVEEILGTAGHVTLYEFDVDESSWSRKDVEGSLFVVKRREPPRFQFVVLNRRSSDNLVEDLLADFEFEVQQPYLLYRNCSQEVNGIWFYNVRECEDVAKLLTRILKTFTKHGSKARGTLTSSLAPAISTSSSTSREFVELEGTPTADMVDGPLEPRSSHSRPPSSSSLAAPPPPPSPSPPAPLGAGYSAGEGGDYSAGEATSYTAAEEASYDAGGGDGYSAGNSVAYGVDSNSAYGAGEGTRYSAGATRSVPQHLAPSAPPLPPHSMYATTAPSAASPFPATSAPGTDAEEQPVERLFQNLRVSRTSSASSFTEAAPRSMPLLPQPAPPPPPPTASPEYAHYAYSPAGQPSYPPSQPLPSGSPTPHFFQDIPPTTLLKPSFFTSVSGEEVNGAGESEEVTPPAVHLSYTPQPQIPSASSSLRSTSAGSGMQPSHGAPFLQPFPPPAPPPSLREGGAGGAGGGGGSGGVYNPGGRRNEGATAPPPSHSHTPPTPPGDRSIAQSVGVSDFSGAAQLTAVPAQQVADVAITREGVRQAMFRLLQDEQFIDLLHSHLVAAHRQ